MQVVLRHDVDNLGLRGEVVSVARGYARNYLLPRGLAELATPGLVAELARREAQHARHQARTVDEAEALVARLEGAELRFDVKAGPTGSLFGSVTATSVADRLWETQKIRIDRRKLTLEPIKRIGRYTAPIEVFSGVTAELRLLVAPEGGELPPDELDSAGDETASDGTIAETASATPVVPEETLVVTDETTSSDSADEPSGAGDVTSADEASVGEADAADDAAADL